MMESINKAHMSDFMESKIIKANKLSSLKKRNTRNTRAIRSIFTAFMPKPRLAPVPPDPESWSVINSTIELITRSVSKRFQKLLSPPQKNLSLYTLMRNTSSTRKKRLHALVACSTHGSVSSCVAFHSTSYPTRTEFSTIITAHRESNKGCSTNLCNPDRPYHDLCWVSGALIPLLVNLFFAGLIQRSASLLISAAFCFLDGSAGGVPVPMGSPVVSCPTHCENLELRLEDRFVCAFMNAAWGTNTVSGSR
mmetsp:Transcript_12322/g.33759  ORF Transcript_12322/g.33759 Transcript_12322/m.33759 type:complete len:251 (-) Transcript_12322:409-1161(-)